MKIVDFALTWDNPEERLDVALSKHSNLSRAFIQEQIKAGAVSVNQKIATKASQKLRSGDIVVAKLQQPDPFELKAVPGNLEILLEDEWLLVINKPQNLVVHPAVGHQDDTLVNFLLHELDDNEAFKATSDVRPGIVHRLDRGTSGVLVVAKDRQTTEKLSEMFKDRLVKKEYEAIVWGPMKGSGKFDSVVGRDRRDRKKMSSRSDKPRDALTHWEATQSFKHFTHVSLFPHTGRTHQLRVHLSEAGFPIVGDPLYGPKRPERRTTQMNDALRHLSLSTAETLLHARRIRFSHPHEKREIDITAPRPKNFESFLETLLKYDKI